MNHSAFCGHSKTVSRSSLARLDPDLFKFEVWIMFSQQVTLVTYSDLT
jgi:hypothetical protein